MKVIFKKIVPNIYLHYKVFNWIQSVHLKSLCVTNVTHMIRHDISPIFCFQKKLIWSQYYLESLFYQFPDGASNISSNEWHYEISIVDTNLIFPKKILMKKKILWDKWENRSIIMNKKTGINKNTKCKGIRSKGNIGDCNEHTL